jgi:hypothetical protein
VNFGTNPAVEGSIPHFESIEPQVGDSDAETGCEVAVGHDRLGAFPPDLIEP